MANYDVFESFLNEKNLYMEKNRNENCVFFRVEQTLDSGANVLAVVAFYDDSDYVDVEIYRLSTLSSPLKEEKFLELINDLNALSRYTKFVLTPTSPKKEVRLYYSLMNMNNNFSYDDAQTVLNAMIMLLRSAEEAYPKFMKLQWS